LRIEELADKKINQDNIPSIPDMETTNCKHQMSNKFQITISKSQIRPKTTSGLEF
jgi:hypothetical protein